ncbi:CAP domain-containing protein [Bacillus songklensis]|uniref:CAP domain-containing protein n=1 Tax=Bacillus songklensis TaxID=1069116 RepID=A0ABV8BB65_9BACI
MKRIITLVVMMAVLLNFTSNHSYGVSPSITAYHDFNEKAYWAQPATWAVEQGVMRGYVNEHLLKPYQVLTEGQYLTMLLRYLAPKELGDTPLSANHWSTAYQVAERYHLPVKGIAKANVPIRRGDTALILAQAVTGKVMTEEQAVKWMYDHQISTGYQTKQGTYPKTYESFHPNASLTRAQGVTMLYRFHASGLPESLKIVQRPVAPQSKDFAVNGITIGEAQSQVEASFGAPKRKGINEYGIVWNTYHQNYQQFFMTGYLNGKVAALYTDQNVFSTVKGIKIGSPKSAVRQAYGIPLKTIQKNGTSYVVEDDEYDMYLIQNFYVTFFYDLHNSQNVTAVQLTEKSVEDRKNGFYGMASDSLRQSFEWQLFDLVNATRAKNGLSILKWHDPISNTARKHSADMAKNDYFSHQNLQGLSPFQRMDRDGIQYSMAGENIAMGQFSSIFAHEALMNSLGHRKNILQPKWTYLGVGVAFNGSNVPYYDQNYFTP